MTTLRFYDKEWYDVVGYFGFNEGWRTDACVSLTCETCGYGLDGFETLLIDYARNMKIHKCHPS